MSTVHLLRKYANHASAMDKGSRQKKVLFLVVTGTFFLTLKKSSFFLSGTPVWPPPPPLSGQATTKKTFFAASLMISTKLLYPKNLLNKKMRYMNTFFFKFNFFCIF